LFKKWFGKNKSAGNDNFQVFAPLTGETVPLEKVPDPVFSQKMMGEGVAIRPSEGKVVSPADGEILQVFPTKHALGIKAENGAEILIHIGLETVALKGTGFTVHVEAGNKVKKGDLLVSFDLDYIAKEAKSIITPVIITNPQDFRSVSPVAPERVEAGKDAVLELAKK
jgi:PTS system glucose-specific IIA component